MKDDYLKRILTARVYDVARETPLDPAERLSRRLGNRVYLKREDLQPVFSFKLRGAYNKIAHLSEAERARGVLAASAGNHAQGVALAAQCMGCRALIVMPITTPRIKIEAVRALGAEVVLCGDSFDEAHARAREIEAEQSLVFVHPYDDPDVIAGQGTIGMELLRGLRNPPHAVFAAVGGGGLIAGVGAYIKALFPQVRIIGVEPVDSDAMSQSLRAGHRVTLDQVGLFADGVAVKQVGEETFRVCREVVDEMVQVDTDAICAAIKDVYEDTRSILEPAGALGVAGLKQVTARDGLRDRDLVAIACGANVNFDRLRHIAERAELGEEREALLAVTIPERPGSFKTFCALLGPRNVTEFNYRLAEGNEAHVFVGVQVENRREAAAIRQELAAQGLGAVDLSGDEMAKLHIRYMVGGRAPMVRDERLYRFEFPERPGALGRFLNAMRQDWNISLFHYRNHGAAFGRVLVGMQVPASDEAAFRAFLDQVGYAFHEETDNPAYRLFLS